MPIIVVIDAPTVRVNWSEHRGSYATANYRYVWHTFLPTTRLLYGGFINIFLEVDLSRPELPKVFEMLLFFLVGPWGSSSRVVYVFSKTAGLG